ncbi:GNAT family protein [Solibacillus sp. FSL K6-1781]|uniref:GNAT family N-acetyltransferase n=1 Tax=Solibacillus sp. FSL K6-1781 TaxID=2921474 RepID=UPI00315B3FC9
MEIFIEKMNSKMATTILGWKYEQPYDFYNNEQSDEALEELMDGSYYAIADKNKEVIGFFCIGESAQVPRGNHFGVYKADLIDMGVGMHPNLVGKGNGFEFCTGIMKFIEEKYPSKSLRLTVAMFNQRAIHLYKKLGFVKEDEFSNDVTEFMTMVRI